MRHLCLPRDEALAHAAGRAYANGRGYSVYRDLVCRRAAATDTPTPASGAGACYAVRATHVVVDPTQLVLVTRVSPGDLGLSPDRPDDLVGVLELLDRYADPTDPMNLG